MWRCDVCNEKEDERSQCKCDRLSEIERAMVDASQMVSKEAGCPEMIWHPQFGWMNLKTGEPKEQIREFYAFLNGSRGR